jgi:coenzyme F420-reducing hydrogenase beta subunit
VHSCQTCAWVCHVMRIRSGKAKCLLPRLCAQLGREVTHMLSAGAPYRRVNSQAGYAVKHRDVPFGERFKVQFK